MDNKTITKKIRKQINSKQPYRSIKNKRYIYHHKEGFNLESEKVTGNYNVIIIIKDFIYLGTFNKNKPLKMYKIEDLKDLTIT